MSDPAESLKRMLGRLEPAAGKLTRERLLFESGRQRGRRGIWAWRSAAMALGLISLALVVWITQIPEPKTVVVFAPPEPPPESEPQLTPGPIVSPEPVPLQMTRAEPDVSDPLVRRAMRIRRDVLRFGIDQLPESPPPSEQPRPGAKDELRLWLGLPPGPGTYAFPGGF